MMRGYNNSGGLQGIILIIYFILGLYLINSALEFVVIPGFILSIEKWILLVSGIFLILGAINYKRASRRDV